MLKEEWASYARRRARAVEVALKGFRLRRGSERGDRLPLGRE
jgi:hypothetical protein